MKDLLKQELNEHIKSFEDADLNTLQTLANEAITTLKSGAKLLIFGNGGSAADAQHFAAELSGRYLKERPALAAIALSTDTSALTAIGNDYGFEQVFARQVAALANKNDLCIGISTSGTSANVLAAFKQAQKIGAKCWMLSSEKCPNTPEGVSVLKASSCETPRIQEMHIFYIHCICRLIDEAF